MFSKLKNYLNPTKTYQEKIFDQRKKLALSYLQPKMEIMQQWLVASNETTNFTYDLTENNRKQLGCLLGYITHESVDKVMSYIDEIRQDVELKVHVRSIIDKTGHKDIDPDCLIGRRMGWYALVRILKPKVVVETGVDKGLGSVVICSALQKNMAEDGIDGRYFGIDINPAAGELMGGAYSKVGKLLVGDAISVIASLDNDSVDMYISDSDHSHTYEYDEYCAMISKLKSKNLIIGDNSHVSESLFKFSKENDRAYLFFKEEPFNHWYPGAGIGISLTRPS